MRPKTTRRKPLTTAAAERAFGASKAAERAYVRDLRAAVDNFTAEIFGFFEGVLRQPGSLHGDSMRDWDAEFDELVRRAAGRIPARVSAAFGRMAGTVAEKGGKAASKQLGIRFVDLGVNAEIGKALDRNVALVEKAGRAYASDVRAVVTDPANVGRPWEDLKAQLEERGNVSGSRAELIARDQTLKLNADISKTRMKNAGVRRYVWSTSRDERVRKTHAALEGTEHSFDAPPVVDPKKGRRCNPGEDYQCRCVAIPVIDELAGLGAGATTLAADVPLPAPAAPPKPKAPSAVAAVEAIGGLENAEYLREGMRDLAPIRRAYAGASQAEATEIAAGRAPSRSTGRPLEPVTVVIEPDGSVVLRDGRHRLQAAIEAGATEVLAKVIPPKGKPFLRPLPIRTAAALPEAPAAAPPAAPGALPPGYVYFRKARFKSEAGAIASIEGFGEHLREAGARAFQTPAGGWAEIVRESWVRNRRR